MKKHPAAGMLPTTRCDEMTFMKCFDICQKGNEKENADEEILPIGKNDNSIDSYAFSSPAALIFTLFVLPG